MPDLSGLLKLVERVSLDEFSVQLHPEPGGGLSGEVRLEELKVRDEVRVAQGRVLLSGVKLAEKLPAMVDGAVLSVPECLVTIAPAYWALLADVAGRKELARLAQLLDRVSLEELKLVLAAAAGQLSGELTLDRVLVARGDQAQVTAMGRILFEGLSPSGKPPDCLDGLKLRVVEYEKRFAPELWSALGELAGQELLGQLASLLTRVGLRDLVVALVADRTKLGADLVLGRFLVAHEDEERLGLEGRAELRGLGLAGGLPGMLDGLSVRLPRGHLDLAPELFSLAGSLSGVRQLAEAKAILDRVAFEELRLDVQVEEAASATLTLDELVVTRQETRRITLQEGELRVEGLRPGGLEELLDGLIVRLPRLTVRLEEPLWPPLSRLAGEPAAANLGQLVNRIELRGLVLALKAEGKRVGIAVSLESAEVLHNLFRGLRLEDLKLTVEGFELGGDPQAALKRSAITLESLDVRLAGDFLNRGVTAFRSKLPGLVESVEFSLARETMIVDAAVHLGPATVKGQAVLRFGAVDNKLRVHWTKFKAVGLPLPGRKVLLMIVNALVGGKKGIRTSDDFLEVDPWVHVPFPVQGRLEHFAVEGDDIVLRFS